MGEQEDRCSGDVNDAGEDHPFGHELSMRPSLKFPARLQPDPVASDKPNRIEPDDHLSAQSEGALAVNLCDGTTCHGPARMTVSPPAVTSSTTSKSRRCKHSIAFNFIIFPFT